MSRHFVDSPTVKKIEFSDGLSLSFEQMARRIAKEKILTYSYFLNNDKRSPLAVLEDWEYCGSCGLEPHICYTPTRKRRMLSGWFRTCICSENGRGGMDETSEEHCQRLVTWIRSFKR